MKKQLFLTASFLTALFSVAQNSNNTVAPKVNSVLANRSLPVEKKPMGDDVSFYNLAKQNQHTVSGVTANPWTETIIGGTFYDLQTNRSTGHNRLVVSKDGTVSAVWIYSQVSGYADRGTGYNYFDGTKWNTNPTSRLEASRTGWPCIGVSSSGKEIGISHEYSTNVRTFIRPAKGTGTWTENQLGNTDAWPRMMVGGANGKSVHFIMSTSSAGSPVFHHQDGAITYSRSLDEGSTWSKKRTIISLIDSSFYNGFGSDQYAIDVKGDTVVILAGGFTQDVVLLKSLDNGTTWKKTIVNPFPIPLYNPKKKISDINNDNKGDTIDTNDGAVEVLLDNSGKVHAWFGHMRILCKDTATGLLYFPVTDGLMYWNESMSSPRMIKSMLDRNGNGKIDLPVDTTHNVFGTYNCSLTSHPSAGIDDKGRICLSYSSVVEGTDDGSKRAYRHSYLTGSGDGGATWEPSIDFVADDFTEGVFAHIARRVDNQVHVMYQRDFNPGFSNIAGSTTAPDPANDGKTNNDIVYVTLNADLLFITSVQEVSNNLVDFNLYPNPANGFVTVGFNLVRSASATVEIHNMLGETVASFRQDGLTAGMQRLDLNISSYAPGLYSVSVIAGGRTETKRLIVQ